MIDIEKYFNKIIRYFDLYTKKDIDKLHLEHQNKKQDLKLVCKNKIQEIKTAYDNQLKEIGIDYKNKLNDIESFYKNKLQKTIIDYENTLLENHLESTKLQEIIKENEKTINEFSLNIPRLQFIESSTQISKNLYTIKFFVDDEEIKEFILSKKLGKPTPEQWEVILCKNSTQLVAAAAGSGKSTTMLLRILVLIKYANVNPNEIVVFSFTKKSCEELRDKLKEHVKKAELKIDELSIERMIRTFHSKVYEVAKKSGILGSYKLFEFIKDSDEENTDDESDIEVDNIFNDSKLSLVQKNILKEVYTKAYHEDGNFKKLIHEIFLKSNLNKTSLKIENPSMDYIQFCLSFSKPLYQTFEKIYQTTYDTSMKKKAFSKYIDNAFFYYHVYLKSLDIYLIFSPDKDILNTSEFEDIKVENSKNLKLYELKYAINSHKKVFGYCDSRVIFVESQQQLNDILLIDKIYDKKENDDIPILFDIKVSSLFRTSLIYEFFYTLISFIESTGIYFEQLEQLKDKISEDNTLDKEHQNIFVALMIYWKFMKQYFIENKIYQFSNLLKYFSENNIQYFEFASASLLSMKNILIDEFQDISPEIVSFIRGAQNYLYTQEQKTSLMCIGDDWQSIYGWRGSTPSYLIDFNKHFNCEHDELVMSYNFRSSQDILSKAEMILNKTKMKLDKTVIAYNDYRDSEFIKVSLNNNPNNLDYKKIVEDINERINEIRTEWTDAIIYILCRQNQKKLNGIKGADKIMTYHSSKGLEADICFLVGDCEYKEKDIIRNLIYRLAKYEQTYDESQQDESLRLAYVAATRAKRKAYWYGLEQSEFSHIFP